MSTFRAVSRLLFRLFLLLPLLLLVILLLAAGWAVSTETGLKALLAWP